MIEVIRRLCCIPFISWIQLFFNSKAQQNVTQSHSLSMKNNMKWYFSCTQCCNNNHMRVDSHNSNKRIQVMWNMVYLWRNAMLMCQVLETFYFQYHFMPRPRKKKLSNAETDMKDNITFAKELYKPMLMRL